MVWQVRWRESAVAQVMVRELVRRWWWRQAYRPARRQPAREKKKFGPRTSAERNRVGGEFSRWPHQATEPVSSACCSVRKQLAPYRHAATFRGAPPGVHRGAPRAYVL